MKVTRLQIPLEEPEYSGLIKIAESELRDPASQIRFLLRQDLERRGLLESEVDTKPGLPVERRRSDD